MSAVTIEGPTTWPDIEIEAPVHLIRDPDDARPIDMLHAANLAVSIDEVGLDHPITLRVLRDEELDDDGCIWMRRRGGHRLAAHRILGRATIPAKVRSQSQAIAKIAEADENLLRRDLTPLERAQAFAERLAAWSEVHPDRVVKDDAGVKGKRGRPPKSGKLHHLTGGAPAMMGFAEETASVAGISRSTVGRALAVHRGIAAGQQPRLHGTWIAKNDAALRQLAGVADPIEQAQVIDVLLDGRTKSIPEARALAAGTVLPPKAASNTVQTAFQKAWKAATPSERAGMLDWLSVQTLPKGWAIEGAGQ